MAGLDLRRFSIPALLVLAFAALGLILAADPGSQADPLATVSYVQRYAQFQHVELAPGQGLKLSPGAELVLLGQAGQLVKFEGYDQFRDRLVNLSQGEPAAAGALAPFQHYLNAGTRELKLNFSAGAELWVRGSWQ